MVGAKVVERGISEKFWISIFRNFLNLTFKIWLVHPFPYVYIHRWREWIVADLLLGLGQPCLVAWTLFLIIEELMKILFNLLDFFFDWCNFDFPKFLEIFFIGNFGKLYISKGQQFFKNMQTSVSVCTRKPQALQQARKRRRRMFARLGSFGGRKSSFGRVEYFPEEKI